MGWGWRACPVWEESTRLRSILWVFRLSHWIPVKVVHTGALSGAQVERKEGGRRGKGSGVK